MIKMEAAGRLRFGTIYEEHCPSAALRPYVRCLWRMERAYRADEAEVVWPDGRAELIFHYGSRYIGPRGAVPDAFVVGPLSEALSLACRGEVRLVGARLHPWALGAVAKAAPHELRDGVFGIDHVLGRATLSLGERLAGCSTRQAIDVIDAALCSLFAGAAPPAREIVSFVGETVAFRGQVDLCRAASVRGWTLRQLERRFKAVTGVGPKAFAVITRFDRARRLLLSSPRRDLLALAHDLGFADQAHMTRDFRRFLATSPGAFRAAVAERRAAVGEADVVFLQDGAEVGGQDGARWREEMHL